MGTQLSEFFADRRFTFCILYCIFGFYIFIFFCNVIQSSLKSAEMHPSISIQPQEPIKMEGIKHICGITSQQQQSKL